MKKLLLITAFAVACISSMAFAGYSHEILNPENTTAYALRTDTDAITCRILANDVTRMKPVYIDCADFAEIGTPTFTGAVIAQSTLAVTGASTLSGDVIGDGGDQLYGFLQDQVASTTTAITAAQCGKTFVSNSADVMTMPEASTVLGCRLTFVCGTADDFDVNPADASDQILSVSTTNGTTAVVTLAPAAGDAIRCTDIGGSITLEATGANAWAQVAGGNGIWTDVN